MSCVHDVCRSFAECVHTSPSLFLRFFSSNSGWTLPALFSVLRDLRDLAFDVRSCLSSYSVSASQYFPTGRLGWGDTGSRGHSEHGGGCSYYKQGIFKLRNRQVCVPATHPCISCPIPTRLYSQAVATCRITQMGRVLCSWAYPEMLL